MLIFRGQQCRIKLTISSFGKLFSFCILSTQKSIKNTGALEFELDLNFGTSEVCFK